MAWVVGAGAFFKTIGQERQTVPGFAFKGRLLVAASDADMLASAYIDTHLGTPAGADTLSVIRLDRPPAEMRSATRVPFASQPPHRYDSQVSSSGKNPHW